MKNTLAVIALLAFTLLTACADDQQQAFTQHDKNKDGKISNEEASPDMQLNDQWVELDENGDGSVDLTEFSRFEPSEQDTTSDSQNQELPKEDSSSDTE